MSPFIDESQTELIAVDGDQPERTSYANVSLDGDNMSCCTLIVRCSLWKYGYLLDKQEKATQVVLEQAEVLCRDLVSPITS